MPGAVWGTYGLRDFHHHHLKAPCVSVGGLSITHVLTCLENDQFFWFCFYNEQDIDVNRHILSSFNGPAVSMG